MKSQSEAILEYLKSGKTLTALEALDLFGCFRLASRISDLNKHGYQIDSQMIKLPSGKYVAEYRLKLDPIQLKLAI